MTGRPTDDELRAMLEARAGSIPPSASREVLAAARTEIGGPVAREGAGVAFVPRRVETARRRSRMPVGVAAAAAAVIVAIAVLGGRLALEGTAGSGPTAGSSMAAVPPPSTGDVSLPSTEPSEVIAPATSITVEELGAWLNAGVLDGRTVVVRGHLTLVPGRCLLGTSSPRPDCMFLRLDGLPDVFIDKGDRSLEQAQLEIDAYGETTPAVLLGAGGGLRLLGWLTKGADHPVQPDGQVLIPQQVEGLMAIEGWLQGADGGVRLTETPDVHGIGLTVSIDPQVSPAAFEPARGIFLVRDLMGSDNAVLVDPRYQVVGRIDPDATVYAQDPGLSLAGQTISAADLLAAIKDGSLDGQLFAIDGTLETVAWDCPLDAAPCSRSYVAGLPGVAITWNGLVGGSSDGSGSPTSPLQGRLIVTPRHGRLQPNVGYLELIGVLHGDLGRPVPVDDLAAADNAGEHRDPMGVEGVDGWLVVDGPMFCALQRPGQASTCPPGRSLLSAGEPDANGDIGSTRVVRAIIHKGAPGIGQLPIREQGPFLVRQGIIGSTCHPDGGEQIDVSCAGGPIWGWIVGARYDPEQVRVVTFP